MTIQVGDTLPSINLTTMTSEGPKPVSLTELSAGKKVVLFAVPGAFTPTCSVQHLPGFLEKNSELKDKGVDIVACISVNDPFVMQAWGEDRKVGDDLLMLSDSFTVAFPLAEVALQTIENGSNAELVDNPLKSFVKSVPHPKPTCISLENLLCK